jgi:hypothetical protein
MRRAIPAVLLAAGCFSVPPYAPDNAVTFTEDGTGGTVAGRDFSLRFAGGDGFHFPDALLIDGVDVMGHAPAAGCFDEDEIGVAIAPTPRISAHSSAVPVMSRLEPTLRGPAVVQVSVQWTTTFACSNTRMPGGTSTFTVFPDGLIVRHDTIADPVSSPSIAPGLCECGGGGNGLFVVSTFWTLARERYGALNIDVPSDPPLMLPDVGDGYSNKATSCVEGDRHQVAFAWDRVENANIRGAETLVGFGRELENSATMLADFSYEGSSALFLGRTGCEDLRARAEDHRTPRSLEINGEDTMPATRDRIYGSDAPGGQGIVLDEARAELKGTLDDAFAVWLRFPSPVDAVRARSEGKRGAWYLPQQVDDRSWIVWFPEGFEGGEEILIEPR